MKIFFIVFMVLLSFGLAIWSDKLEYDLTGKCEYCIVLNLGND